MIYLNYQRLIFFEKRKKKSECPLGAKIKALTALMASPGFADNPIYTALWHHSEKNGLAINNCYLDSLVNDIHMDNNLKKILVHIYFCSIVNNQPKRVCGQGLQISVGTFV